MRKVQISTATGSTIGGLIAVLGVRYIPKQYQYLTIKTELELWVCLLPMFIAFLLVFRPMFLKKFLGAFGVPHLDMNVDFKPKLLIIKPLWFISSVSVLTMQFIIVSAISPLVLVLRAGSLIVGLNKEVPSETPKSAKLLLLLAPKSYRENLVGDLEQEFRTIVLPQYGAWRARWWYRWQVACSLLPIIWNSLKRAAGLALLWKLIK